MTTTRLCLLEVTVSYTTPTVVINESSGEESPRATAAGLWPLAVDEVVFEVARSYTSGSLIERFKRVESFDKGQMAVKEGRAEGGRRVFGVVVRTQCPVLEETAHGTVPHHLPPFLGVSDTEW